MSRRIQLKRISEYVWQIPIGTVSNMRVPGMVYADDFLLRKMQVDRTLVQCANVATLPGIYKYSITLPDGHEGYGFPIGGVAATDATEGVISPGGVGYDINCGVRLVRTNLTEDDVRPRLRELLRAIFRNVPAGLGSRGKVRLSISDLDRVLEYGVRWAIERGYGWDEDADLCEEGGYMENADSRKASSTAKSRGAPQLGSLGSGNHFLEIQRVDRIYNPEVARAFGIKQVGQITIMIHTGSRGLGHQVCSDYLRVMERAVRRYGIWLPDRELACAPGDKPEACDYFDAMAAAANFAWCNRQMITHWVREAFEQVFNSSAEDLDLHLIYDVAHNIAKREKHKIDGEVREVWVHRKGATRALGPGHPDVPRKYRALGQPVLIPGSMQDCSYLSLGTKKAEEVSFASTAHGAGRMMSRAEAKRRFREGRVRETMEKQGVLVECASVVVLAEEAGPAYKPCDRIALVSDKIGIAKRVARLLPIAVAKG